MNTIDRAKRALWHKSGLSHDYQGDVAEPRLNLVDGVTTQMIEDDYRRGSGQEWLKKFKAIHSSAALTANTFGRWKRDPAKLKIAGMSGFQAPKLEAQVRTGLGGTPPNLDVLLESSDVVIGIESKLLEPLRPTKPTFSTSYELSKLPLCEKSWWELLSQTRQLPAGYLDVAQLIKHYLGLRKQYADGRPVYLLYLFWRPHNATSIAEYVAHAADLAKFQCAVAEGKAVQFIAMDYLKLWESWSKDIDLSEHAEILMRRYCVEI